MRILLSFILSFFLTVALSQTTPLTYTIIPTTSNDLRRPGGGAEQWNGQNTVNIPVQGQNTPQLDAYWRFQWIDIQPSNASGPGLNLNFSNFDAQVNSAINNRQAFNFGIMSNCCNGVQHIGGKSNGVFVDSSTAPGHQGCCALVYPLALHRLMQTETTTDWNSGGAWYENSNSPNFIAWFRALHQAVYAHILATTFNGVRYRDVVKRIDIRIAGDFGEQAVLQSPPPGVTPTVATFDTLVNCVSNSYPTIFCTSLIGAFANGCYGFTPAAAGAYALQKTNLAGATGWRWDSWGWTDGIYHCALENNANIVGGYRFDTAIMNRYKYAPVGGEPADLGNAGNFADLPVRVNQYHAESFGDGNLDVNDPPNATIQNNFRAASKAAGYRLVLNPGGSTTTAPASGGSFVVIQHWRNVGLAPSYENWTITYDLRATQGSVPAFIGTSSFNPRLYGPAGADNVVTDNFTLTGVPAGTYQLNMTVKDPLGYRFPMPIFITNTQQADGSYIIQTNVVVTASGAVANAGPNQNITISSATVSGSASSGATSFLWTLISGPNTPVITTPTAVSTTITGMITGTYVFQLGINGQTSGQGIDQINIVVAIPPVVANAGANQAITPPASSVTVNGSASTGPITSYLWTLISGPNTPTITNPTNVSTSITGLIAGTYTFRLSLNGGVSTDDMTVTLSASPVASAGPDQTIQLPTSSVTVDGSGSTGATTYAWTRISGPNTPTITTPSAVSTTITGLIAGTYIFQLSINSGASTDQVQITVNPIPVVAKAGNNQTITLPTTSVTLDGSASTGVITTYAWTLISGPNTPTITTPTTVSTTVTGMAQGTYTFQLSVNGGVSTSTVNVTVLPAPPPTANAGASQTISLPTASVTVSGSASTGTITSYLWSMDQGPNVATFGTATTVSTTVNGLIQGTYVIRLTLNGGTATDTMRIYVNPAAPPVPSGITIFTTQVPGGAPNGTQNDGPQAGVVGIEVGVKFRASSNGFVTGVRFYKTNTLTPGTHTGELYSYPGGVRLASAVFTSETLNGWQYVLFSSPVAITSGTTYIAAVFSSNGNYRSTLNYFNTAVVNTPLTALADGTDGVNGVFKYTATPALPNTGFQKSNYWVDPLFSTPTVNQCNCHVRPKWEATRVKNGF